MEYGPALSVPSPEVTTREGRGIRTVHYTTTTQDGADTDPQLANGERRREVSIRYPDKERQEDTGSMITIRNGDRRLASNTAAWTRDGYPSQWCLSRTIQPLLSPDAFTRAGAEAGLLAADVFPNSDPFNPSSPVVEHHTEQGPQGQTVVVTELKRTTPSGTWKGTLRTALDPVTGLVSSWNLEAAVTFTRGPWVEQSTAPVPVLHSSWRTVCERVEYNTDLPDALFSTEPPGGALVTDVYSPKALKRDYEEQVRVLQERLRKEPDPEQRARNADFWGRKEKPNLFECLQVLPQKDQDEIRAKLREIGINLPE